MAQNKMALQLQAARPRELRVAKRTTTTTTKNVDYGSMAEQPPLSETEYNSEKERFLNTLKV